MTRQRGLSQWHQTVSTYLPDLSTPQLTVLVLWSVGIVLAQSCGLSSVALLLAYLETITNRGLRCLRKRNICFGHCWIPSLEGSSQVVIEHWVRTCSSRCAPFFVQRICCFFTIRLLTTWFTVDSTKPVVIASP
jgi:hypothetical protein